MSLSEDEGEEPIAGFLKTIADGPVLKPPLADEGFSARFDLFACVRVEHGHLEQ
jgi:hypothetical protein